MTKRDKDDEKRVLALLVDAAEHEQTPDEAEAELLADGVNVSAFLGRVHEAVLQKQKEERLAWHKDAHRNLEEFAQTQDMSEKYAAMTRAELVSEAHRYASELHFKNFEEATEEDLRTQLADRARLAELRKRR